MPSPAAFNRLARLQRHSVGAITHTDDVSGRFLELPNVGYHYRLMVPYDLAMTSVGAPAGRFLSGHFGSNTARFVCPTGIVRSLKYTLNVSSPIYETDGYGNYALQLIHSGNSLDPFVRQATTDVGFNRKERSLFAIFNATTGAIVQPDSLVAGTTNYNLRGIYHISLTLGEAATAGLIPVQDIRIAPQLFLDLGNRTDVVSTAADFTGSPVGNYEVFLDYFTTPSGMIAPDTNFVMQTRRDLVSVVNTGEQFHRPQIGGIFLRNVFTVWNNARAVEPATIELLRLRIQQGIILESRTPDTFIADERRWYGKKLMDEIYAWDHIAGMGNPGMPSLRDRVASNQLTRLEYILNWSAGTAVTATAELRNYIQQLVPLPRVM